MSIPFGEDDELSSQLQIVVNSTSKARSLRRKDKPSSTTLPGNAFLDTEPDGVFAHLSETLLTPDLDRMAPHLWLVGTYSSSSISALHQQVIIGRTIVPMDGAKLHLLWYHAAVFIKPLPLYLLSHSFWVFYFNTATAALSTAKQEQLRGAAIATRA